MVFHLDTLKTFPPLQHLHSCLKDICCFVSTRLCSERNLALALHRDRCSDSHRIYNSTTFHEIIVDSSFTVTDIVALLR
jgi:hypothetical protein